MPVETRTRIRDAYSTEGDTYDEVRETDPRGALLSDHDVRLFRLLFPVFLKGVSDPTVLEIGAGTGRFTLPAVSQGAVVHATDINEAMLRPLRQKIDAGDLGDRCTAAQADVFALSFEDESYNFVMSFHVIPRFLTLDDQRAALTEITRVLKPGGRILFNYRNSRSPYRFLHKGHTAAPSEIEQILNELGMRVVLRRGKWFLNRRLINRIPLPLARLIAGADFLMRGIMPSFAWDVFLIAEKS